MTNSFFFVFFGGGGSVAMCPFYTNDQSPGKHVDIILCVLGTTGKKYQCPLW